MAARTRYVDAASAGGDGTTTALSGANAAYATLNAALVAEYAATPSLVTAVGILTIQCVGTTADTGAAVTTATAPFTTNATNYLVIETPLADRTANPWVWSASRYRWVNIGTMWSMRNVRVVLRGLQIENNHNSTSATIITGSPNAGGHHVTVEECLLRQTGSANTGSAVGIAGDVAATLVVRNTIIIRTSTTTGTAISCSNTSAGTNARLDSNTIIGTVGTGIAQSSLNVVTSRNNIVSGVTTCFTGTQTQSYNASTDATAAGTGSRISQTFTFQNAAGGDYRITGADAGARTFGTDLSGDANNPFSTDYAQTTRGATWDIGAHQITAASSAKRPLWLL